MLYQLDSLSPLHQNDLSVRQRTTAGPTDSRLKHRNQKPAVPTEVVAVDSKSALLFPQMSGRSTVARASSAKWRQCHRGASRSSDPQCYSPANTRHRDQYWLTQCCPCRVLDARLY